MSRPGYHVGVKGGGGTVTSLIVALAGGVSGAFASQTRKITMPARAKVIGVSLNVAARGGTHSTSTVDVQDDGVSILAAVFNVASLTPGTKVDKEGTALAAGADDVAKDSVMSIVLTESGGTSPVWTAADLQIDYVQLGG